MRGLLLVGLLALVVIALWSVLRQWGKRPPRIASRRDELVKDPVCETYILMSRAIKRESDGVLTYFCSPECAARYARGERRP